MYAKVRGEELSENEIRAMIGDIVEGRHSDNTIADLLVAADRNLTDPETAALALGGIPGRRTTIIVVPLVAAHGLAIPKTSSRAITSAADCGCNGNDRAH